MDQWVKLAVLIASILFVIHLWLFKESGFRGPGPRESDGAGADCAGDRAGQWILHEGDPPGCALAV
jgi:hypothetical protein